MAQQVTLRNFLKGRVKASTVLDYVEAKLVAQGCKSIQRFGYAYRCAYRGDNGNKCAVGFLIPDSQYRQDCEGLIDKFDVLKKLLPEYNVYDIASDRIDFLKCLQRVHDNARRYADDGDAMFIQQIKYGIANLRGKLADYGLN